MSPPALPADTSPEALDGVTAAATGSIAGAAFVLGRRAIIDVPTVLFALVALGLLTKFKKIQEPVLIVGAGVLGCLLRGVAAP